MRRRGITLIETLAATALLATMAVVCLPLLHAAMRASMAPSTPRTDEFDDMELALAATSLSERPEDFGIDPSLDGPWTVWWSDGPDRRLIEVTRCESRSDSGGSAWLVVRCGGMVTMRWVAVQKHAGVGRQPVKVKA